MSGAVVELGEADLAACAKAYDPALHEAPLVIGHPKHDAPAYGWVHSLDADKAGLNASPKQVDVQFAELVDKGSFKKISASFYTPDAPNNPVPGVYYLRHVGFLGAQPPAVKGLREVAFAEAEEGVVEFSDPGLNVIASVFRRVREWFLTSHGQEVADKVLPDWEIESIREISQWADPDTQRMAFADAATHLPVSEAPAVASTATTNLPTSQENHVNQEEAAALSAENTQLKQQLAAAAAQREADQAAKRHDQSVSFADGLVSGGTLAPKHKDVVVAFLNFSEAHTTVEFGEGDAKQPLATAFKSFLGDLPKVVDFGEHATKASAGKTTGAAAGAVDFGENVDQSRLAKDREIRQYMQAHGVDYDTAATRVMK